MKYQKMDVEVEVVSRGEKLRKRIGIESERKQCLENGDCRGRNLVEEQEAEMMRNEEGHIPPSPPPLSLYFNKPYYIICHQR